MERRKGWLKVETKYLSRKEKLSFTVAAFGRSGIYTIYDDCFYMVFLVDVVFQGMKNAGVTASTIIFGRPYFLTLQTIRLWV